MRRPSGHGVTSAGRARPRVEQAISAGNGNACQAKVLFCLKTQEKAYDSRMRSEHIFLLIFLVCLLGQGFLWQHINFLDQDDWLETAALVYHRDPSVKAYPTYGYPGGPPLALAAITHHLFRVPLASAYPGSIAILNAAAITLVAMLCRALRPGSPWYLGAVGMLLMNRLYVTATPPSALVGPLLTALLLLLAYTYEHRSHLHPAIPVAIGSVWGLSVTNRFDISLLTGALAIPLLISMLRPRQLAVVISAAIITFGIGDPYLWFLPWNHIQAFIAKASHHYQHYAPLPFSPLYLLLASAFALLSIFLTITTFATRLPLPLPRKYTAYVLGITSIITLILLNASYHATWYFLPLIFFWETVLPLTLLQLLYLWRTTKKITGVTEYKTRVAIIILLTIMQWALAYQAHLKTLV